MSKTTKQEMIDNDPAGADRPKIDHAHKLLTDFINGLSPADAETLWLYFDGCNMFDIIGVAAERAISDPEIKKRQLGDRPEDVLPEAMSKKIAKLVKAMKVAEDTNCYHEAAAIQDKINELKAKVK